MNKIKKKALIIYILSVSLILIATIITIIQKEYKPLYFYFIIIIIGTLALKKILKK